MFDTYPSSMSHNDRTLDSLLEVGKAESPGADVCRRGLCSLALIHGQFRSAVLCSAGRSGRDHGPGLRAVADLSHRNGAQPQIQIAAADPQTEG